MSGTTTARAACHEATEGLCHVCGRLCEARTVVKDGRVFLDKWCPEHGRSRALTCADEGWYRRSRAYVKPGARPRARAVLGYEGCPASCGLCPRHMQHSCVPLLEITDVCDMDCPICMVHGASVPALSVAQVREVVDALVAYEGRINMLTLSGGEPTCHSDLLGVVDAVRRPEVGVVSLSTNGLRLEHDDALLDGLVARDVVFSLQFDGCRPSTWEILRGRADLAERKPALVRRILARGGRLSLTFTLARGVNEDELAAPLDLLFSEEGVVSVMVQPLVYDERTLAHLGADREDVVTVPDAVRLLAAASGGLLREADFTPLPCSHPSCFALTYLLKLETGRLVPLSRLVDAETYLDIAKNQALFATDRDSLEKVKDALYTLWSSDGLVPDREAVLLAVKRLLKRLNRLGPEAPHGEVLSVGLDSAKSIFIHHFMDRGTFDLSRAVKCCNHYPQPDGRLLPACVRNNLGDPGSPGGADRPD